MTSLRYGRNVDDPLTGRTIPGARGMAVSLLAYANREAVAKALTERGYSVTRNTVNRWARGSEMPDIAARMIAELFGHDPDTTNSPPAWAEGLANRTALRVIEALVDPEALAAVAESIAALEAHPPRSFDSPRADVGRQDQAGSKR